MNQTEIERNNPIEHKQKRGINKDCEGVKEKLFKWIKLWFTSNDEW